MEDYLYPLVWLSESFLKHNPFYSYGGRNPLLHQTEIVAKSLFLKPTRMLIADAVGLGKTITALRILAMKNRYRRLGRVLIAAPGILVDQWRDEMTSMGIPLKLISRENRDFLRSHEELPGGWWYIGSIDTIKRKEYMEFLERSRWDAIVIDEAHRVGLTGSTPNQRFLAISRLIRRNRDAIVILLSATPHKGKARDYLARLSLLDPTLYEAVKLEGLDKHFDTPDFYMRTHNVLLYRRSKEDVNRVYEGREVFKPSKMIAVLVEPNETERRLLRTVTWLAEKYVGMFYAHMMEELDLSTGKAQAITALLRTILVKRGLSSPNALFKTFEKLVVTRGEIYKQRKKGKSLEEATKSAEEKLQEYYEKIEDMLSGEGGDIEKDFDDVFNEIEAYLSIFLADDASHKLQEASGYAEKILSGSVADSKLEALKKILEAALTSEPDELPEEFRDLPAKRKVIVFTEFRDTAEYIGSKLEEWIKREFGDPGIIKVFTAEQKDSIEEVKNWLAEDGPRILVTTDVAGEGLNLHYANVLVNYEITWSPIRMEQRIGRIWRYGQDKITYVFNLFLADALEKMVAEVVFSKLYGITVSLGKQDPIMGEKILVSTIKNELLEHAVEEGEHIRGLVPVEIEYKGRRVSLSEPQIIDLVTRDAEGFIRSFIKALSDMLKEIKRKRIFPEESRETVKRDLQLFTGFTDTGRALEAARRIVYAIAEILDYNVEERGDRIILVPPRHKSITSKTFELSLRNPERILRRVVEFFKDVKGGRYFFYPGEEKRILLVSEAEVRLGGETVYREPVGVSVGFEDGSITILRGDALVEEFTDLLSKSIIVHEVYGIDDLLRDLEEARDSAHSAYYGEVLEKGAVKFLEGVKSYEDVKKRLGGREFFHTMEARVIIGKPRFIFISNAFLPDAGEIPEGTVKGWADREAVRVVMDVERRNGREPVRVSEEEHYDVKSIAKDSYDRITEERIIEAKLKEKNQLWFELEEREVEVAEKMRDKYWVYLVYGAMRDKPIVLAIRDPLSTLPHRIAGEVVRRKRVIFGAK